MANKFAIHHFNCNRFAFNPSLTRLEKAKSGHEVEETSLINVSIVYLETSYSVQGNIFTESKSVQTYSLAESLSTLTTAAGAAMMRRQGSFASIDAKLSQHGAVLVLITPTQK